MQPRVLTAALLSAALGCAAAVAIVSAFDLGGGHTTTVVQQAPLAETGTASTSRGLTARDIYRRDAPGVVFIRADVVQRTSSPFDFGLPQEQRGQATGSGFVISRDGTILTNAHVVNGATKVTVQFADKQSAVARVLGKDESTDLALLKVDPKGLSLTPLVLGSSRNVQVGDPAIAIGNPFGLERTLTTGVISAVKRTIRAPNNFQIDDVLQTDAPINPGNSGGPLIDAAGRVIGINSQIETGGTGSTGNVGIGFAIPIDTARSIIPQLKSSGKVDRGYLGVQTVAIDAAFRGLNLPVDHGALVSSVVPNGPADQAGLRAGDIPAEINGQPIQLGGDIIVAVDGKPVRSDTDLANAIASKKKGDKVKITFVRNRETKNVQVTLAQQPTQVQNQASSP
jgi:S1-C subfamily serine protease